MESLFYKVSTQPMKISKRQHIIMACLIQCVRND